MNKALIIIGILFLTTTMSSCSYSPIFSEKNYNFEIEEVTYDGEKQVNKVIANKLNLIQKKEGLEKKKYKLNIFSKKKRNIISKDSKGDPLKFELIISVEYTVADNKSVLLNKELEKNNIYNSVSDLFELEKSEKIIIENISGNISDIIISSIINLDDN